MKQTIMILVIAIGISSAALSQTTMPKNPEVEAQVIALEKAGWEAWKNKDLAWYKANTAEDFMMVLGEGTRNKAEVLKATPTECDVKSFSLSDFKFVMLNENAVLMSYTAVQDAVCGGKPSAPKVRASVNYVKRGGKWLEAFYMETPVMQ
jgi:Domain of unknown function (DUF4440)